MRASIQFIVALCFVFALGAMNGCGTTKPSRFYALTPVPEALTSRPADGPAIGVGPVRVAEYLDRSHIVRDKGSNEIQLDDFNRWIEPLDGNITRVLGLNLSAMVPTGELHRFPWRQATAIDFQVVVNIIRFHANTDNEILLTASWSLLDGRGQTLVPSNLTVLTVQAADAEYTSLAIAMSEALARLSREIAEAIQAGA
jgi:hypothetical protein